MSTTYWVSLVWVVSGVFTALMSFKDTLQRTQRKLPAGYDLHSGKHHAAFVLLFLLYCLVLGLPGAIIEMVFMVVSPRRAE